MYRDQQREAGFKSGRQPGRRAWEPVGEQQHQREARELGRQSGKLRRAHALRVADAQRQIREIGSRY